MEVAFKLEFLKRGYGHPAVNTSRLRVNRLSPKCTFPGFVVNPSRYPSFFINSSVDWLYFLEGKQRAEAILFLQVRLLLYIGSDYPSQISCPINLGGIGE